MWTTLSSLTERVDISGARCWLGCHTSHPLLSACLSARINYGSTSLFLRSCTKRSFLHENLMKMRKVKERQRKNFIFFVALSHTHPPLSYWRIVQVFLHPSFLTHLADRDQWTFLPFSLDWEKRKRGGGGRRDFAALGPQHTYIVAASPGVHRLRH